MTRVNQPGPSEHRSTERFLDPPLDVRDGVRSWTADDDPPRGVDEETLAALNAELEERPLRKALTAVLEGRDDDGSTVRDDLVVDPADAWRIPVADAIGGRCLDVNAGVGTRSLLLAELAESVDSADTSLDSLVFLDRRDDYASGDRVTPIHAEPSGLPTPSTPYDTIVVDCMGPNRPDSLESTVGALSESLADDGSLILLLDGWTRLAGLSDVLSFGGPVARDGRELAEASRTLLSGYHRRLTGMGFADVTLYGMVPDPTDPSYVVPVDDDDAVSRLLATARSDGNPSERGFAKAAGAASGTRFLDRCWPAYVAACRQGETDEGTEDGTPERTTSYGGLQAGIRGSSVSDDAESDDVKSDDIGSNDVGSDDVESDDIGSNDVGSDGVGADNVGSDGVGSDDHGSDGSTPETAVDRMVPDARGLLERGDGRSTVSLEEGGTLVGVTKVPHRRAHAEFALDECRTMRALRETDPGTADPPGLDGLTDAPTIPETIPDGSLTMTRFGPTYTEEPAPGTRLDSYVTDDPERFRQVLHLGFDWLVRLQRRYGDQPARWSRGVVRNDLSVPEHGIEPPRIDESVRLFRAPCHGEFRPENVFVADGTGEWLDGLDDARDGGQHHDARDGGQHHDRGGRVDDGRPDRRRNGRDAVPTAGAKLAGANGSERLGPVTAVIDWELSAVEDNPIADPGYFALQTARLAFGGLEEGIDAAFATPGPHADAVRDVVGAYCDAVGVSVGTFCTYLPIGWIRDLRRCTTRGATASYSSRAVRRADEVRLIRERRPEIAATLGASSGAEGE